MVVHGESGHGGVRGSGSRQLLLVASVLAEARVSAGVPRPWFAILATVLIVGGKSIQLTRLFD